MESSSSGRFLMLCFVMLLCVAFATGKKGSNDICKEKDKPGFKLNLTAAMIFVEYILLIDSNLLVYEVPKSNYDGNSYGKMTLNIKGKPFEEYWPKFATNSDWQCIRPLHKTIYNLNNKQTGDIFVNIFVNKNKKCMHGTEPYSLCYNLKTKEFCPLPTIKTNETLQFCADTGLKIYSIQSSKVNANGVDNFFPMLRTWNFTYSANHTAGRKTVPLLMYYLVGKDNSSSNHRNVSFYSGDSFTTTQPEDVPAGYRLENITDWHLDDGPNTLPVGYLFKGSFYLYALDKLIIFEDRMPSFAEQDNSAYPDGKLVSSSRVTFIRLSDYIQCDSEDNSTVTFPPTVSSTSRGAVPSSTDSGTLLIVIASVAVFLLILIVTGITIYCLCSKKKNSKKKSTKEKDSKGKKLSNKSEKPSLGSSSVAAGSKVSSKIGGGGSKMAATSKQSSVSAAGGGQSKAASSISAAGASKVPQSKMGKKNK